MAELTDQEIIDQLHSFDTPSITNVVATYPGDPLCLGIYNPWTENWYTDQSIRCMYPELGPRVGYAVTCVYGLPDPNYSQLSFLDVIDALEVSKQPTILAFQQKFPPEIAGKVGLAGGNMTAAMKAVGCVGAISNGPSRDIDEIRPMEFQYLLSGVTPGHGAMAIHAINVPVSIGGMDVSPGELIHMDENGACKFPADKLADVFSNVQALREEEEVRINRFQQAQTAKDVRGIFGGTTYGVEEDDSN
ncbi:TPA: RraA family protein [Candidatus Poribacteria bacterium]|nr:RraA family protein [Candidatus Poribacteria bacterium]HIA69471.1 RraA family protein [Candidatus Poribacteria bacterium]HIB90716.1 RraA family protein [Candidatus Poribacteria bacterium]HIM10006.1 RraA family protein [Candidatus Poribacteria bacterium]HIN31079.1 RraA family protein [Candidatus Poribacteria bacterium]